MTITLNGTTGITTPDITSSGALGVDASAPDNSLVIDSSGNVGIGTSSPSSFTAENDSKLTVGTGSGNGGITVYTGNTSQGGIFFADGTSGASTYSGMLRYNHSADAMVFYTNGLNERMRIDSAGRVTMPYQPAFRAYNASAAISANVSFANKDSAFSGRDAGFSTSTGLFTAPVAGVYVFSFSFLHNNLTSTYARVLFRINGVPSTSYGDTLVTVGGSYVNTSASMAFALAANDTVGLYNEGVAIYGTSYTSFSGFLIG